MISSPVVIWAGSATLALGLMRAAWMLSTTGHVPVNPDQMFGGLIGAAITGLGMLAGELVKRRTNIDTSKIDDSREFTRDLMAQLETTKEEVKRQAAALSLMQRHELSSIRRDAIMFSEIRLLAGHMEDHSSDLESEPVNLKALRSRCQRMSASLVLMVDTMEEHHDNLIEDCDIKKEPTK